MKYRYYLERLFSSSELIFALRWLAGVIIIGIIGFLLIEDLSMVDSIYMTVITISTVGFTEVKPLSPEGRIFTSILIVMSVLTYAYLISVFTRFAIKTEFYKKMKERVIVKEVSKLKGHTIVCGYGRNGRQAIETLKRHNKSFVVIDNNEAIIEEINDFGILAIEGDATRDSILEKANISEAEALIAALPHDANNLFIVLTARQLKKDIKIISRATNDNTVSKLYVAGANNVIMPDKVGGSHMATLVVAPDVVEFIDEITVGKASGITLEEVSYNEIPENLKGKTVRELGIREMSGCTIVGFKTQTGEIEINPSPDSQLEKGCKLFVLGNPEQIKKLNTLFGLN
ncbi:MAG: potassium channel protein [Flavobacteriales bacterium]|nr:potassium channel protein [Flavobacteriales bacterium]